MDTPLVETLLVLADIPVKITLCVLLLALELWINFCDFLGKAGRIRV